ncbi:MAG TPA: pyrroline-5-carboxylate reductase [Thermotogota bacterium]|nr:pyrroline-5-carboxylate reductase [Thermotogota bacterium]HPJ89300.1 pyrroline-5-carboxylate reductase [Thermotogota bacterium]HPR95171.1 pyrroline-5-carboxylate reductase [Thermotogota bacterium]
MNIGVIGVGNIGSIFTERLADEKTINIVLFDKHQEKIRHFESQERCSIVDSIDELVRQCQIIILAVKPQDINRLLTVLGGYNLEEKTIISTVTGISITRIMTVINTDHVARIMPNVPAAIGKGVTGICFSESFSVKFKQVVISMLENLGKVIEIEERHFPAVTALSGSGPAFVFVVIESMIDAGLKMGLSYEQSRELVIGTLVGSAELLEVKGNHPGEFRHLVTSPAGTTIEGIYSLEREGLRGTVMKAINDTFERAKSISDEIERNS